MFHFISLAPYIVDGDLQSKSLKNESESIIRACEKP